MMDLVAAEEQDPYDVIVVGGGPAGLAAALWLARYRCRVRVIDAEDPRNAPTWAVHGYLGLEDVSPLELRRVGREQAMAAGAEFEAGMVSEIKGEKDRFEVSLGEERTYRCRRVLLCTGLKDIVPEIPGIDDFIGRSIWHCPDCDGPSVVGKKVAVIGWGRQIAAFCMWMLTWTDQLTLLTHGHEPELPAKSRAALERFGIAVRTDVIDRLKGEDVCVHQVVFHDGSVEPVDAVFYHIASGPGSTLPVDLGCDADDDGILVVDDNHQTSVPGVYAAGDNSPGSRLAIRAAGEGTRAAIGLQKSLIPEDRRV